MTFFEGNLVQLVVMSAETGDGPGEALPNGERRSVAANSLVGEASGTLHRIRAEALGRISASSGERLTGGQPPVR